MCDFIGTFPTFPLSKVQSKSVHFIAALLTDTGTLVPECEAEEWATLR